MQDSAAPAPLFAPHAARMRLPTASLSMMPASGPGGSAAILAMDVCVWKPLVATCGADRTLKVWNYLERHVELEKAFAEEARCVALHPSGLFVVAAFSVMLQVASFKLTGRRIFRMAPLHHHFELKGWAEPKVIVRFWIITVILVLIGLASLKIR